MIHRTFSIALTLAILAAPAGAQEPTPPVATAPLSVYLDCQDGGCDFDFFRTEMTFVNWVRDRQVADVHILVTSQGMGSGGREYTATFIGLRQFAAITDTLKYMQPPATTADERRKGLARVFRIGLVRYLARTPAAERLTISVTGSQTRSDQTRPQSDPWNSWVFQSSIRGWSNGEETYRSTNLYGNLNADRITAQWKTRISLSESYNQNDYEVDDTTTFVNISRSYGATVLQVKSLGRHWSAGARVMFRSSTYDNFLRAIRLFPAIEYNLFPYEQSTRKQLRFEYNLGYARFDYRDTTIFDKMRDQMPLQRLIVSGVAKQPWGSVNVGIEGTSYLHDLDTYRVSSFGDVSWRLFKGFDLGLFGGYDIIYDQFSLAKKDFTPEEILTRQFRRGSRYSYWGNIRLSYTFGSLLNNVVNPRMGNFFE